MAGTSLSGEDLDYIKMDYSLETPEERVDKVEEIIAATPSEKLNNRYLEAMADYILKATTKKYERKRDILTENRLVTVNKKETSFEGLACKLENGEDGIYNLITNDKNIIFQPKIQITEEDIATIPGLRELVEAIKEVEAEAAAARGKRAYALKKQAIEMRRQQYELKEGYTKPIRFSNISRSLKKLDLTDNITIDEEGNVHNNCIVSMFDPKHISVLLCGYSKIKEDCYDQLNSDIRWMMEDLDNLIDETLREDYPLYYRLLIYKIDGKQNAEIQKLLEQEFGIKHSVEYISSLWRNKIPKLLAERATNDWLEFHFTTEEKGKWKKCSRCGQIKLAHNNFFSKNKTSKDGFYSICKCCRNKKKEVK